MRHSINVYVLCIFLESQILYGEVTPTVWSTPYSQPYFDNTTRKEITTAVGQAALLRCRVRNLADREVKLFNYLHYDLMLYLMEFVFRRYHG